jgi:dTDP-glucose 4,6-dehydratase
MVKRNKMTNRYFITGGFGFIGSTFIHYLQEKEPDCTIINLDKCTYAADVSNLDGVDYRKHKHINADLNDIDYYEKELSECDYVVHFAAESHVDNSIESSKEFFYSNVAGTYELLELCRKYDKRIHYVSTDEVFGQLGCEGYFTDNSEINPSSPYSASKACGDLFCKAYYKTHNLKVTISNCSNNYGPRQHIEKLIPKTIYNIINDITVPIYGDGKNIRDWIHVKDHCDAIYTIVHRGTLGNNYCIGGNDEIENIEIYKTISGLMQQGTMRFVEDRKAHDFRYAIKNSNIYKLGWQPKIKFEDGIKETIEWYKKKY